MNEAQVIARFVRPFARAGAGVRLGIGDDAALLNPSPGTCLVVTTDAVHAGVHFGKGFRNEDIGHKALAVNLSDLAAMGATPRWFVVALALPPGEGAALAEGLGRGMAALARKHDCTLVGGNVVAASQLSLTVTALGEVRLAQVFRRDGLRSGDIVAVTGELGGAAVGLRQLRAGKRAGAGRQLRPAPRLAVGMALRGLVHAAIDISDGLASDLKRLAEASRVGIAVHSKALPLSKGATLRDALTGGEDYELLVGVPARHFEHAQQRAGRAGARLTAIGRAESRPGVRLDATRLADSGFDHFSARRTPK